MGKNGTYPPVNIWNNIERVWVEQLDFVYEGNTLVGIHHSDWDNAIAEIENLCKKLERYKKELLSIYNLVPVSHRSMVFTYIYLIKDNNTGYYKIGRSINPYFREKTLLSQTPNIERIFVSQQTEIRKEKELHKFFREKRVRGEWFNLSESDILFIKSFDYGIA